MPSSSIDVVEMQKKFRAPLYSEHIFGIWVEDLNIRMEIILAYSIGLNRISYNGFKVFGQCTCPD